MRKTKSPLNDKIKSVKNTLAGLAMTGLGLIVASQDVDAQKTKFPENQDHGAAFYKGKTNSVYSLEEKVFYNAITGKEERFYMQYVDKNKYANDLDIVALDFYKTIPKMNLQTGKVGELRSEDGSYYFTPEKLADGKEANSIVIEDLHIADWCDDQIRERAGVEKGINYISITDMEKLLPEQERLRLGDNRKFIVLTVPKELQTKGKTNYYLVPVDAEHEIGFNPVTKKLTLYGKVYRGNLDETPVKVDTKTGVASPIGTNLNRDESFQESKSDSAEVKQPKEKKPSKLSLIVGGEGDGNAFWTGELGVQYGPIAIVGDMGKGANEYFAKDITTTASPITGRYGHGRTDITDVKVKGAKAEVHILNDKAISPFAAFGLNNYNYNVKDTEEILDANGNIVKQNVNTRTDSENSMQGVVGTNIRLGKNGKTKLRVEAGYDTKAKFFGGAGFSFSLN